MLPPGLGLGTDDGVDLVVDLMGGTIQVSSRLGKGSVFTVELELPIQEQEADPFWAGIFQSSKIRS